MALSAAKRKRVTIDQSRVRRVQRLLDARTAADAVDKALDQVLFGKEGIAALLAVAGKGKRIIDVFGNLANVLFDRNVKQRGLRSYSTICLVFPLSFSSFRSL
jgi:hypothetical protein